METQPDQVGAVTSSASEEITASNLSDVDVPDKEARMKDLEEYIKEWILFIEDELDGVKTIPPMSLILFPTLINEAWYSDRLVPWRSGSVDWEIYMDYLKEYFKGNRNSLLTLSHAAKRCVEMEKYLNSLGVLRDCDKSLSEAIMVKAECMIGSEGTSVVAAAGFMCIAEEAELMAEHGRTKFRCTIRQYAFDLMCHKVSERDAVAAAMLAMSKETSVLRGFFNQDEPDYDMEISTCSEVRLKTLALFTILKCLFTVETDDVDGEKVTPAGAGEKVTPAGAGEKMTSAVDKGNETLIGHDDRYATPAADEIIGKSDNESVAVDGEKVTPAGAGEKMSPAVDKGNVTLTGHDVRYATPAADEIIGKSDDESVAFDGEKVTPPGAGEKTTPAVDKGNGTLAGHDYRKSDEQSEKEKQGKTDINSTALAKGTVQEPNSNEDKKEKSKNKNRIRKTQTCVQSIWMRSLKARLCSLKTSK